MKSLSFLFFIVTAWSIMFLMHWVPYNAVSRVFEIALPLWPLWLAVVSFTYFLASTGVRTFQHYLADIFYFLAATWLGIIFLVFSSVLLYELLHLATGDSKVLLSSFLFAAFLFSFYALYNGRTIITKEHTVPIRGLETPLRIAHLSDIHVGTVHQKKYLDEVVEWTNALKPDLVLVTGDLFDGSAPIDETILQPLNHLNAPSYFSNGNHEEYEGLAKVKATLKELNLQMLDNEVQQVKGVQIIGINDRQSIPKSETLGSVIESLTLVDHVPILLMYHSPVEWRDARKHGVQLMLSGHTHNGQIYPFNLLVRIFFKYVNGLYKEEDAYLHVSPGTGTWGPPMRLGSRNQITLITLTP